MPPLSPFTPTHTHTLSCSYIEHVLHQEAGSWAEFDKVDWRWFSICQPFTRRPGPEHLSSGGRMGRRTGRRDGEFDVPCFDSHQAQPVTFVHVKHRHRHRHRHKHRHRHRQTSTLVLENRSYLAKHLAELGRCDKVTPVVKWFLADIVPLVVTQRFGKQRRKGKVF